MAEMDKRYLGHILLNRGFRDWFLYVFRVIEGFDFIEEDLHKGLFDEFEDIYSQSTLRSSINVPPRAGKTTLAKYFLAYSWAKNPKCNFIYTSYSQELLKTIALEFINIIESGPYKAMHQLACKVEDVEDDPIDEFWREHLIKDKDNKERKATYSSKKITSPAGGVILFSSVGASITGFGAGTRTGDGFTGALIIDDANKPADIHSEVMRKKVVTYYVETLLSRLNSYKVAIINIQQRLHLEDLTAYLLENYEEFHELKRPLIVNGVLQLPSQYDDKRLKEVQQNEYMFAAQYLQDPVPLNGNFGAPNFEEDETLLYDGLCQVDAGFSGSDYTALTIMKKQGDKIVALGKIWDDHIENVKYEIYSIIQMNRGGTVYIEENADKGYVAKSFRDIGLMVSEYHEKTNKHVKIMTHLKSSWKNIYWVEETDKDYLKQIRNYDEKAAHDDAPDSAASMVRELSNAREWRGLVD